MGLRFSAMNFHGCISFILSQNAYHALILDHLQTDTLRRINRYTVDSRYNEPRRKTKSSSLYREFVKSKIEKNLEFLLKYLKNPV